jgi:hypothetical protein
MQAQRSLVREKLFVRHDRKRRPLERLSASTRLLVHSEPRDVLFVEFGELLVFANEGLARLLEPPAVLLLRMFHAEGREVEAAASHPRADGENVGALLAALLCPLCEPIAFAAPLGRRIEGTPSGPVLPRGGISKAKQLWFTHGGPLVRSSARAPSRDTPRPPDVCGASVRPRRQCPASSAERLRAGVRLRAGRTCSLCGARSSRLPPSRANGSRLGDGGRESGRNRSARRGSAKSWPTRSRPRAREAVTVGGVASSVWSSSRRVEVVTA